VLPDYRVCQFPLRGLATELSSPNEATWQRLRHLVRYLNGCLNEETRVAPSTTEDKIQIWVDADWAGDRESRKSIDCIVARVFGVVIHTSVKGQMYVAQSSAESELGGSHRGCLYGIFLQNMIFEFFGTVCTVEILTDSSAGKTIALRKGCGKVRHLDTKQLYIQDLTGSGRVRVLKCRGGDNLADMGTKPLARSYIERYKSMMGIAPSTTQCEESSSAPVVAGSTVRNAVAALVSALLVQPSTGVVVEPSARVGSTHEWRAGDFYYQIVVMMLFAVVCMLVGAGAFRCSRCFPRRPVGESGLQVALVVATPSSVVTPRAVARVNTPPAQLQVLARCADDGHETNVTRNQFAVSVTCRSCEHHFSWRFNQQNNRSFRRHPALTALVGVSWDRGRAKFLSRGI
jgi:hypothetical protein